MLKIGIVGYGKIGRIRHDSVVNSGKATVVAIYDKSGIKHRDPNINVCSTYEDLLNQDINAIFVCAYNNVLASYSMRALNAGMHVFCEKPPARTTAELKALIEVEKRTGCILKYGFNHRYHYSVIEAKKIIESGAMGRLLWMRGVYGKAGSIDYHKNWRNYKKLSGGGILLDQGIHMLDLMMYFANSRFGKVNSLVTTAFWNIEAEDNAFVIMQNNEDVIATLHSSATQWRHKFLLELCFENGFIDLDGILSGTRSYAPEKLVVGLREFEDITYAMGKPKENVTWFENDDSWDLEVEEFIDAVLERKPILNGTSNDALNVLSLVEEIYENSGF